MTSAFIIEVNSQLQPDPNDETAALLRVLIYKIDNTTFGNNPPALPEWTGPPHTIVQVQAILFASLAASLFSAFLAMLGKQWLNKYASIDVRGSVVERGQNRQRKLDGIVTWYFDHVMEALPLMLQVALLLLGCALARYFWDINTTVASVILAITSFGVLLYLFFIFVGAAFLSCPYQTPGARILRPILWLILDTPYRIEDLNRLAEDIFNPPDGIFHHISDAFCRIRDTFLSLPHLLNILLSALYILTQESISCSLLTASWGELRDVRPSRSGIIKATILPPFHLLMFAIALVMDACRVLVCVPVLLAHVVRWGSDQQMGMLDQHCISWTLQTSLDGPVRLSTLNYLATMTLVGNNPTLVAGCLDVLSDYVKSISSMVVITEGMEQLVTVAALCFLHTLSHFMIVDPKSRALQNIYQQYDSSFPPWMEVNHPSVPLPLRLMHGIVSHQVLGGDQLHDFADLRGVQWEEYEPSSNEHAIVACGLAMIAQFDRRIHGKVPRWLLRFALHSLSRSPPPSTSVVASCLSIIAIDLGCDPSDTAILDKRCVHIWWRAAFLTKSQDATRRCFFPGDRETQKYGRSR